MKTIASFRINHDTLTPGLYTSRVDGDVVTYDLRFVYPNTPPFLDVAAMHTIEHLFATYVRNSEIGSRVIYFGPMGCQTGFYLLVRNADNNETLATVRSVLEKIIAHEGTVPGATRPECGNYKNLDLASAKTEAERYLAVLSSGKCDFKYPEA